MQHFPRLIQRERLFPVSYSLQQIQLRIFGLVLLGFYFDIDGGAE
ncbi:hypothetical protein E6C60_1047 [Paenibacillus algicola]|uniref:Uncharacterized protein n=1 Tax=Paenibacillus algicola TaxID=2565926 RepID=A0A4P8XHC8_9BACL|nr:hypothetical protein E6C60_1047 [Paenibacillus algicola]